jgi:hypothetical protein
MESSKTVSNVVPKVLQGVDRWKADLAKFLNAEETDRHRMQQQILSETSFSGSEGEVVSPFGGRRVIQRSIEEESRFSYASSDEDSEDSDSLSSVSDLSDCAAIQRALDLENSFSSDCSQDLSGISLSDEKQSNPRDLSCDRCWRFFHAEYVRARNRKSLLALAMAGAPYLVVGDTALPFVRECCAVYYEKWL